MKVALLSSIAWRTPPRKYGPWEQVTSLLCEGLFRAGVAVTLFATLDSETRATLDGICPSPYGEDPGRDAKVWECLHISHLMEKAGEFDLIHNHFDFLPLSYSRLINTPMLTTIHGFSSEKIVPVYKKYNPTTYYVSISDADRHPELTYLETIYHGLDPGQFDYRDDKEDYLLYFGRIHPDKGTREAISIAEESGRVLHIAGLVQDEAYFREVVNPYIDGQQVIYHGNVGPMARRKLLAGALALLHPIAFEEPFGLSVAEALMSGTPVIAFPRGSMPELICEGKTGFLPTNVSEAVATLTRIGEIDPQQCRDVALQRFSQSAMTAAYLAVYQKILGGAVTPSSTRA